MTQLYQSLLYWFQLIYNPKWLKAQRLLQNVLEHQFSYKVDAPKDEFYSSGLFHQYEFNQISNKYYKYIFTTNYYLPEMLV